VAHAQNPPPPAFHQEAPPDTAQDWKVQAKGGLIMTSGNSQSTNGILGVSASRRAKDNKVSLDGQIAYGRSRGLVPALNMDGDIVGYDRRTDTTTNAWQTRARYDRFLTPNNSLRSAVRGQGRHADRGQPDRHFSVARPVTRNRRKTS
jgi:hypothetical protein